MLTLLTFMSVVLLQLQTFHSICWLSPQTCKNRWLYNLYCVGAQSISIWRIVNSCHKCPLSVSEV